jgi:hypothetical protein
MKNLLLILTTLLLVTALACTKTKQRILHNKDWKNIQGNWDIQQVLIDGKDSTASLKSCDIYSTATIKYQTGNEKDGTLHVFDNISGIDYGSILVEKNKYKRLTICGFNLNINTFSVFNPCLINIGNVCIVWDVLELNNSQLKISTYTSNYNYIITFIKI